MRTTKAAPTPAGYTPRPATVPTNPSHQWQRNFEGDKNLGHALSLTPYEHNRKGFAVFRDGQTDQAQLCLTIYNEAGSTDISHNLTPATLRELAYRLLDAAHDIDTHPAISLQAAA